MYASYRTRGYMTCQVRGHQPQRAYERGAGDLARARATGRMCLAGAALQVGWRRNHAASAGIATSKMPTCDGDVLTSQLKTKSRIVRAATAA